MWSVHPNVVWEEDSGRVFVTHAQTPDLLALNEVGSFIWLNLDQPVATIAAAFDGEVDHVVAGIERFLADLAARNFIIEAS